MCINFCCHFFTKNVQLNPYNNMPPHWCQKGSLSRRVVSFRDRNQYIHSQQAIDTDRARSHTSFSHGQAYLCVFTRRTKGEP